MPTVVPGIRHCPRCSCLGPRWSSARVRCSDRLRHSTESRRSRRDCLSISIGNERTRELVRSSANNDQAKEAFPRQGCSESDREARSDSSSKCSATRRRRAKCVVVPADAQKTVEKKALSASKQPVLTHPAPPTSLPTRPSDCCTIESPGRGVPQARPQQAKCRMLRRILKKAASQAATSETPRRTF